MWHQVAALPNPPRPERAEFFVVADDGRVFNDGLRREQAVERVAVFVCQLTGSASVFKGEGQMQKSALCEIVFKTSQ